ncbi:MAG: extracellular solute-binding protein [Anaerolineae bacterium]|nr:extracellular solute-binding protein [Thermoflexales bacterium]MDW8407235.1 extracellular solute-binding protein [Anaerolineae bacterium]
MNMLISGRLTRRQFLALTALAAGTAACSPPPSRQILTLWHPLTGERERVLLDLIDQWNRGNPAGAIVTPERRDAAAMRSAVLNGVNGGNRRALPNLLLVSPSQAIVYHRQGVLATLDTYVNHGDSAIGWSAGDRSDLYPFVLQAGRLTSAEGELIGIPFGGVARVLFANRDWLRSINFETLPADWEQFSAVCTSATDRSKGTLCFGAETSSAVFEEWLYAHGGALVEQNNRVAQLATPSAEQALNRLTEFLRNNLAYRVGSPRQSRDDFTAGRVIFAFDWSDQIEIYRSLIQERANFDWQIGLLPTTGSTGRTVFRAPLWVITRTDEERQLAAWQFIRWLMDTPQTAKWAARTGELPARVSAIINLESQMSNAAWLALLKTIAPLAQPEPLIDGWECVQDALVNSLRQVFEGRPASEALQAAQSTAQQMIDSGCSLQ